MSVYIQNFSSIEPRYTLSQEELLKWLSSLHKELFNKDLHKRLSAIGSGFGKIKERKIHLQDCVESHLSKRELFGKNPALLNKRMDVFEKDISSLFRQLYENSEKPDHLIHTSCTGYVAPIGHPFSTYSFTTAYHMGCYAALPSIRMAYSFDGKTDIVHTEYCSLHINTEEVTDEELVIQSLFGDGFIKYTLSKQQPETAHFKILSILEQRIPDTENLMSWKLAPWGFKMTLQKEVPLSIKEALPSFLEKLAKSVDLPLPMLLKDAFFAIHPGGPKIIQEIATLLKLEKWQYEASLKILQTRGNMSSATLPHIWQEMLKENKESYILSLGFGPGLTLMASVFKRISL